jgi:uncharacterized protein with PQ loop repeat
MKIVFFILWLISFIVWLIYSIITVVEIKKNGDYLLYCLKMNISLAFMLIFSTLVLITK